MFFDGNLNEQETIEGPKLYKRNGWYYIFAPAGGVKTGWQTVLRSRNIFGPYEYRVVMRQGDTPINGPHQGAWVDTVTGEDWFLHFQDVYAAGRIIHLQPMSWKEDWPIIGIAKDGNIMGSQCLLTASQMSVRLRKRLKSLNQMPLMILVKKHSVFSGSGMQIQKKTGINLHQKVFA